MKYVVHVLSISNVNIVSIFCIVSNVAMVHVSTCNVSIVNNVWYSNENIIQNQETLRLYTCSKLM